MSKTILIASCGIMLGSILWPHGAAAQESAQETRTSKERLTRKANDEQRVDNCKVPIDLRGPTPRPGCPGEQSASSVEAARSR
jgi:hypothetical protein